MKRNRLIDSSKQTNIFSRTDLRFTMRRHLLALSLLTFAGVFITTIVLATSKPEEKVSQTQAIALPNLPVEMQSLSATMTPPPADLTINKLIETQETLANEPASIVVDDVTYVEEPETVIQAELNWQEVIIKSGDNLSRIFPRVGLTARDVYNVAQLGDDIKPLLKLKPGQSLRFAFKDDEATKTLQQLQLQLSAIQILNVISTADGLQASLLTRDVENRQTHATGIIESSLFEAGIDAGLSNKLVMELAYIFGWDIDFALDLRKQDHFKLIYSEDYLDGEKIADGAIVAAEFTNQGKTFRAIRYTDNSGSSNYFSPEGDSMRKAFSRTPVHFSRISSRFNPNRKHPVLKT
ncbi:MAG: peptidase M23, partial [Proteobacteria bacterium]|nr:peptidase M23 [Pseudomonadota bacterium]